MNGIIPVRACRGLAVAFLIFFNGMLACAQNSTPVFSPIAPDALSNSFVRCFYKDTLGYMWIGTADGLIRYDGTNSYRYEHNPDDPTSICHSNINAILEDANNQLWIGTAQGLALYNREADNFITVDSIAGNKNHLNNHYITSLTFDKYGMLWIGTHGGGINIYDPVNRQFTYLLTANGDKIPSATIYVNVLRPVGDLMWCGTKGGLVLFNVEERKQVPLIFAEEPMPVRQINQLVADKAGNIWLSTVNGEVIKIVPRHGYWSFKTIVAGEPLYGASWSHLLALCPDAKGNFWISGENAGLNYLDTKSGEITRYMADETDVKKMPTNSIRTIYIDDTGLTWIGTFNKGAYLIDDKVKKFQDRRQRGAWEKNLAGKHVRAFAEDSNGNIWIGFDGEGLKRLDANTNQLENCQAVNRQLLNKYLTALACDRYENLWIGTGGKGIYQLNIRTGAIKNYALQSSGFGNDRVATIYEDKKGKIWAGTSGSGLFYFNRSEDRFVLLDGANQANAIPRTAYISAMVEDAEGIFWVGTMYGLYALTPKENGVYKYQMFIADNKPGSLSSSGIQAVYEDNEKQLWIGTTDNGVNVKRGHDARFEVLQKKDGLSTNSIRAIVADAGGNIWFSGNMGLSKFNPITNTFNNFSREDGLSSNNFYANACLRTSTGELFFGSNNGFNAFYPDSIRNTAIKPVLYFSDLKINNSSVRIGTSDSPLTKHISLTSEIELAYDQRSFAIDFVAVSFGQTNHKYCYKLEGFDKEWNCIGSNHSAIYTNIDPGHYTLYVKAANNDGVWSEKPLKLEIDVSQALWKTWWAKMLYAVAFTGIVIFLMKIRFDRMKMKNQLQLERIAREHEHEVSESKTQFFTNISHEFRTPLSLILMPLESLMTEEKVAASVKERISTAYKSADKMMRLVNELMDFNKIESGSLKLLPQHGEVIHFVREIASAFDDLAVKRNIKFSFETENPTLFGWFDRDKLEKVIVNLLSNAFKFTSDGGQIALILSGKNIVMGESKTSCRCLQLIVIDNGMGISAEEIPHIFEKFYQAKSAAEVPNPGTGIGLSLAKALVELHQGSITVESKPDKETRFTIILPIDAHIYDIENVNQAPTEVWVTKEEAKAELYVLPKVHEDEVLHKDKPEILIVEDNDELRTYLAAELRNEFNVLEASDGEKGLRIAMDKVPDLIISDILMANKTGIELCQAIRSDLKTSHIPLILLTAKATVEDQIAGIETGADVYLTKPFSIRFLLTHVRNIIDSRQKLYSLFSHDVYLMPNKIASNELDQTFLQRAVDYIIEHIQDSQLGVDSLADLFNLSRVQVYRKIKALTGKTAVEFIRTVRLKQALKLMEMKKYTLSEIAFQTGFNTASYFTRTFKEEYGKAPSEYLEVG